MHTRFRFVFRLLCNLFILLGLLFFAPKIVQAQSCSGSRYGCDTTVSCNFSVLTGGFSCGSSTTTCSSKACSYDLITESCRATFTTVTCTNVGSGPATCNCSASGGACGNPGGPCGSGTYNGVGDICNCTSGQTCNMVTAGTPLSCSSSCVWSAYSACTAPCGGGTKTRTSSCGGIDIQPCNTQSCGAVCGDGFCDGAAGETCAWCGDCKPSCSCAPSCPTQCGQSNGCSGTCGNTDAGVPGVPTGLTPTNGSSATPDSSGNITVSWTASSKADLYDVEVYPTGTTPNCGGANNYCQLYNAATSFTFKPTGSISDFTWHVRAYNTTCSSTQVSAWTSAIRFTLGGDVSGTFYYDPDGLATVNAGTGLCEYSGSLPGQNPGSGASITAKWSGNTTTGTITGTTYSTSGVGYDPNTIVTLTPDTSQYTCTCPAGCSYSGVSTPRNQVHFFLSNLKTPWWQTSNGLIYAGTQTGNAVVSQIPTTCSGSCTPALSKKDTDNTANSAGYTISGGGQIDTTADTNTTYTYLNPDGTSEHVAGSKIGGAREDYTYFSQLYSMSGASADFTGDKPGSAPTNGRAYYASGDVTINNAWTVNTDEKIVVFINGNLTVNAPITVAKNGFVAFIVKGNVNFSPTVGQADPASTTAVVAGVFIADGQINIQGQAGNDLKFVGEGTFVGWSGFSFGRDYVPASANNTNPTELFKFRPDFMLNVPERMTRPIYLWQETN